MPLISRALIVHWALTQSKFRPKAGRFLEAYDLSFPGMHRALLAVLADRSLDRNPDLFGAPGCRVSLIISTRP
jgi:hypothetical protein